MASDLLAVEDIDEISYRAYRAKDPLPMARELITAVADKRIARAEDVPYALCVAAEIVERTGDVAAAEALASRAARDQRATDPAKGYPMATHARLLWKVGREREAMRALERLRPLLTETADAAYYVPNTLEEWGRADLAEHWLTDALAALFTESGAKSDSAGDRRAAATIYALAVARLRVRQAQGLPSDDFDELAVGLREVTTANLTA
jgi:hypothetical protein